jgi:hypothetical protein
LTPYLFKIKPLTGNYFIIQVQFIPDLIAQKAKKATASVSKFSKVLQWLSCPVGFAIQRWNNRHL